MNAAGVFPLSVIWLNVLALEAKGIRNNKKGKVLIVDTFLKVQTVYRNSQSLKENSKILKGSSVGKVGRALDLCSQYRGIEKDR